jgi:hypothetical protein
MLAVSGLDTSSPLSSGKAGIRGLKGATFANFQVRPFDPFADDTFARINALDNSLGNVWIPHSGGFTISSDNAVGTTSPTSGTYNIATFGEAAPANVSVTVTVTLASSAGHRAGVVARYQDAGDYYAGALVYDGGYQARIYRFAEGVETQLGPAVAENVNSTSSVELRFEVLGTSLVLYVNGEEVVATTDDRIAGGGGVGIYSSSDDPISDFTALLIGEPVATGPSANPIGFGDAFFLPDATSLQSVAGWEVRDGAVFTIADGRAQVTNGGTSGNAVALVSTPAFLGNTVVEADVLITVNDRSAGLLARYQGTSAANDSYYLALVYRFPNGTDWTAELRKRVGNGTFDSSFAVSTSITNLVSAGEPIRLRFEVIGTTLTLYVNGVAVLSKTDNSTTPLLDGKAGLWGTQDSSFDNVQVREVDRLASDSFNQARTTLASRWAVRSGSVNDTAGRAQGGGSNTRDVATIQGIRAADVAVTATVTVSAQDGHEAGVVALYQNPDDYYAAVITYDDSTHAFYAWIYHYTAIGPVTVGNRVELTGLSAGAAVNLGFEVVGSELSLQVDGVMRVQGTSDATPVAGEVGLTAFTGETADDFSAFAL